MNIPSGYRIAPGQDVEAEKLRPDGVIRLLPDNTLKLSKAFHRELAKAMRRPDSISYDFTRCFARALFRAHKFGH